MDIIKNTLIVAGFSILVPACVTSNPNVDTDGDGMIDSWEQRHGLDINDASDAAGDTDGDGLTNLQEYQFRSNPNSNDSDGDTLLDGDEVAGGTHPAKADTDNDGLNDNVELDLGTDPTVNDTDGDGLIDGDEVNLGADPFDTDSDNDTISDGDEVHVYGSNPMSTDSDGDGLSDGDEVNVHGTSPASADTDGDTLSDPDELAGLTFPDGVASRPELIGVIFNTSPLAADTDGDGVSDGEELNTYGTDPLDYADKPANAPVTWMYESFERTAVPDGFVLPATKLLGWEVVANESASGRQSLRSVDTSAGDTAEIELTANFVEGALYFDFRVDAEQDLDSLRVYVDGSRIGMPTRETLIWQTVKINLSEGQHTIKWVFNNAGYAAYGQDAAWIDGVRFKVDLGDYDQDTMPDLWEAQYALNRLNPANAALDADNDGLTDLEEFQAGTNPLLSDTDGDGLNDIVEINDYLTDPLLADTDGDGLSDSVELSATDPTNPLSGDSDGDNFSDGFEVEKGTNPNNAVHTPGVAEFFVVNFPDGNTEDWGAFNRPAGWVRNPLDGSYTIGAAPLRASQVIEWNRYFVNGVLNLSYTAIKKVIGYEYIIKIYLDDVVVAEIDPGYTTKFEVQWADGTKAIDIAAGYHTIRWEVQIPDPVWRYEVGLYIGGIYFQGVAPTP